MTRTLPSKFFDITFKNDTEVAKLSQDLGLDITVDFMGFTGNYNRFGYFGQMIVKVAVYKGKYSITAIIIKI